MEKDIQKCIDEIYTNEYTFGNEYINLKSSKLYINKEFLENFQCNGKVDFPENEVGKILYECSISDLINNYFSNTKSKKLKKYILAIIEFKVSNHIIKSEDFIDIYRNCRIHNINQNMTLKSKREIIELVKIFEKYELKKVNAISSFIIVNNVIDYKPFLVDIILTNKVNIVSLLNTMYNLCDDETLYYILKNIYPIYYSDKDKLKEIPLSYDNIWARVLLSLDLLDALYNVSQLETRGMLYFENKDKVFYEKEITLLENIAVNFESISILNSTGINFYIIAENMLNQLEETPLVDYSSCSLQYFKIIELLLKKYIIWDNCRNKNAKNIYKDIACWMKLENVKYDENWINFVTLEKLRYLMINLEEVISAKIDYKQFSVDTINFIRDYYEKYKLDETRKFFIDLLHRDVLSIFRNPPAHAVPCSRETALKAKKLLFDLLHRLTHDRDLEFDENGTITVIKYNGNPKKIKKEITKINDYWDLYAYYIVEDRKVLDVILNK